ncbi:hypothetical protein C7999DRAFT_16291 [Corynascus novoguineensis]|uniref:Uncharacterized protein n=1 Tax=Corynascus novoguineensis TaxID=1126955 RepID=A0AAN7CQR1_9PEZI|nr:hypothetical protein C7999DRAFT_16291 [Corynascus novoguineensis]
MAWNSGPAFAPLPGSFQTTETVDQQPYYSSNELHQHYQQYRPFRFPFSNPASPPWSAPLSHSSNSSQQYPSATTSGPASASTSVVEYPFLATGKRQMTLFAPDGSHRPLLTVVYTSNWASTSKMTIYHGGDPTAAAAAGREIGGAVFHSFTTDEVDAYLIAARAGGVGHRYQYRFRKQFASQTGLCERPGAGMMKWAVEGGALALSEMREGPDGYLAQFVPRDGADAREATKRMEGRLTVMRAGLNEVQFGEVVLTLVAEMERRRRDNEDWHFVEEVWEHAAG